MGSLKLILLDRDGVINEDSELYIKSPEEWYAIDGSLKAIAQFNKASFNVAIATNQSGVGRGYYNLATLQAIHDKMMTELEPHDGHLDAIFICPHHPDDDCPCRKPKPGLLEQASHLFKLSPEQILFIGDSYRDYEAALAMKCAFALVKTGNGAKTLAEHPTLTSKITVYDNLADAAQQLC